jgi:septin 3/9/12
MIPFAVVGSENNVIIDGKTVRGRKNRWGVVNVEDQSHCEFMHLRNFLTRSVLHCCAAVLLMTFLLRQDALAGFD